jgi:hypothetical protein
MRKSAPSALDSGGIHSTRHTRSVFVYDLLNVVSKQALLALVHGDTRMLTLRAQQQQDD